MPFKSFRVSAAFVGLTLASAPLSAHAQGYKQIYSFVRPHGAGPVGPLVEFHGRLFGTTLGGGMLHSACRHGCGVVFSIDPKTGKQDVVYAFQGEADGGKPEAGLIVFNGLLYGTASEGGDSDGNGVVFSVDPGSRTETVISNFQNGNDGSSPDSSLTEVGGLLYGVTTYGGTGGVGTVYSLDPATGVRKTLYAFQGNGDAAYPIGNLTSVNGKLYGASSGGGANSFGTIFSIDPASGAELVLHGFGSHNDGSKPAGNLTKVGNKLYGATGTGGASGSGTVFSIVPATGKEKVVYSFTKNVNQGVPEYPNGGLVDIHGTLYGTTEFGDDPGCSNANCIGTIFSFNPLTRAEAVLYTFGSTSGDGTFPYGPLTNVGGTLYGTTIAGGNASSPGHFVDDGVVFAFNP